MVGRRLRKNLYTEAKGTQLADDEVDPNWPPPKPKTSAESHSSSHPSADDWRPRTPTPPRKQPVRPVAGPPVAEAPTAPRPPWQRPSVILLALTAAGMIAALVPIAVHLTRSNGETSRAKSTTNEVTTGSNSTTVKPAGAAQSVTAIVSKQTGFLPFDVQCPRDIPAVVGTEFECTFTGPDARYIADMRVTKVEGDDLEFYIETRRA